MVDINLFPGGKTHALTLSYDDGEKNDRKLTEIFRAHNLKATFHLCSGLLDKPGYVTKTEIQKLYDGFEVAGHTVSHPFLTRIPKTLAVRQILDDRAALEDCAQKIVTGFSYPYGDYDAEVKNLLISCGIDYSRTTKSTADYRTPQDFYEWHPTCHHRDGIEQARKFIDAIDSGKTALKLLYVWGHSYEFERNNNWQLIEEFCRLVSNNKKIWYATNVEIFEYIKAQKALKFSADGRVIHNPSALDVWVTSGGAVKIPAGKTLRIA